VQGYVHEALLAGAELLAEFGLSDPEPWRTRADELRERFRARFWTSDDEGSFPALALDRDKKPVDSLTSNIGHVLGTGMLDPQEIDVIAGRLLSNDMVSGFGVRTMSRAARGYSPLSYHCGSVWPHDTAIIARELSRAGHTDRAGVLAGQLLDAAESVGWRLPELYAGFGTDETAAVVAYPAACRPQAWSAASAIAVLQVLLGLTVDVPNRLIRLDPPRPSPVGAITVTGLPLANGQLNVSIDRTGRVLDVSAPADFAVHLPHV
jgi:glycogen debranching enzyme